MQEKLTLLEERIEMLVSKIRALKEENELLKRKVSELEEIKSEALQRIDALIDKLGRID